MWAVVSSGITPDATCKVTVMRPYTGFDGNVKRPLPSMNRFIDYVTFLSGGGLWNNGSYGVRLMRGKESESIHGTGRAVDLSWRKTMLGRGRKGYGDWWQAAEFVDRLLITNADVLQIELVLDYTPKPFGRGWRCDRGEWQNYARRTIAGAPGGDWWHVEISPAAARDPQFYDKAFSQVFG